MDIKSFFTEYETAFNSSDINTIATCFADEFIMTSSEGSHSFKNDSNFKEVLKQGDKFYRKLGMKTIRIISFTEFPIDANHKMAEVSWGLAKSDGTKIISFDVSYIVRLPEMKILMFISHNENERLKEKGLL